VSYAWPAAAAAAIAMMVAITAETIDDETECDAPDNCVPVDDDMAVELLAPAEYSSIP